MAVILSCACVKRTAASVRSAHSGGAVTAGGRAPWQIRRL